METAKLFAQSAAPSGGTSPSPASALRSRTGNSVSSATIADGKDRPLTSRQAEILEARGINIEVATRMGWRSALSGTGEIEIPYYREGKEVNCKTRSIEGEKRFFQVQGADKCFYNLDAFKTPGDEPVIITEGEMDCLIALQCGHTAVSVPDGAPQQAIGDKETVKYDYLADVPKTLGKIILATDNDPAGVNLMNDLALRLGKHRCMWIKYPVGCKDLNDAFQKYGRKGVDQSIATAQYLKIDGWYLLDDLPPITEQPSFDVGIPALKDHFRLRRGDFSVVTGIPSHGKSTFINHVAFNMAEKHDWNICFASFEQPPQTEHARALRTLFAEQSDRQIDEQTRIAANQWINRHMSFIVPEDDSDDWFDMQWLKDRMAAAVTRHDAAMIVIDPWNEIDHAFDQRATSLTQYVGKSIKELKRFARAYNVHVMVIAHPAKMRKDDKGKYPIPSAYDISDSSHWYNKPDQILVVHREDEHTVVRVAKSRYHYALGKPGDVNLNFDAKLLRYA